MSKKIKVWGRTTSSNVKKVLWVAHDLKIDIDRIDAGGKYGVVDTPAYKALNPNSRVPTIEDGDFVLWESNSIMRYFCDKFDGEALYPADPQTRADINRWLDWALSVLVPADTKVFLATIRVPEAQHDKAAIAKMVDGLARVYDIMNKRLEGRKYVVNDRFSLADIAFSVHVDRWLRNPFLKEKPDFPNNTAWLHRVRENHEGFRKFVEIPLE
jgi:glutathione S-transferase